jgi:hypothetical protein
MVAMITRPWIGRRSRLDGPRRQRGRRRRAVVGQGRARHRVLGGALAGRTVPACSSSCSGGWTSSKAQGGAPPALVPSRRDPGDRGGGPTHPQPHREAAGLGGRPGRPPGGGPGRLGPPGQARSWGRRVASSTVTGPKDGQRRVVTPDRPPVRNAGRRTSATFHLDPWPGAGPGAWSAASGPPGGRSAAQDQLGGLGTLASRRVAGIGRWTASPARGGEAWGCRPCPPWPAPSPSSARPAVGTWSSEGASGRASSQVSVARPGIAVPAAAWSACSGWPGRPSRSDLRGRRGC